MTRLAMALDFDVDVAPDRLDGGFVAEVVQLPGIVSQGDTAEQAADNARQALSEALAVRAPAARRVHARERLSAAWRHLAVVWATLATAVGLTVRWAGRHRTALHTLFAAVAFTLAAYQALGVAAALLVAGLSSLVMERLGNDE